MKVGVHQGIVLSPLLFIIVLVTLSKEFWTGSPWELLYVDDLVISAEPKTELRNKLHSKSTADSNAYKSQRNHTNVLVRKAKKQHIRNLLNESARDPGGFWKSLRKREKSIKGKVSCVKLFLIKNNKLTANSKAIANGFCSFFSIVAIKPKTKVLKIKDFVFCNVSY